MLGMFSFKIVWNTSRLRQSSSGVLSAMDLQVKRAAAAAAEVEEEGEASSLT
jgi:hypothetical protein